MKNLSNLPQLNVSDTPTIGFPLSGIHSGSDPVVNTDFQKIHAEMRAMRAQLDQQSRLLVDIFARVHTPWYSRLMNWIFRDN